MKFSDEAAQRIVEGEDPESLVHRVNNAWLSSGISQQEYSQGGYIETYRTLAAVAGGCWD